MIRRPPSNAIAIVGLAGRFPGASDLDAFWRNIRDGVESLTDVTEADLDAAGVPPVLRTNPRYVRKCTALENADHFDASFFGYSPREAQILDPQQRVFLECAWEAVEHAGYAGQVAGRTVGVFAGASMNTYLMSQVLWDPALAAAAGPYQLMLGNDKDFLCTRVAYELDLRGPAVTVQTACSTSLVAVQSACRSLQRGECEMALAGGVSVSFPVRTGYLYEEGMILSPDGHCRPFDERAAGTRSGNGAGIVVLKRLADAMADRDTIHAVILGSAINNDGSAKAGFTAPSIDGQAEVVGMALAEAGIEPRSIGYVETHGTATPLGDPIEIAALTRVYRATTPDLGFCRIGSLKANLGHLDAAAGVAGLIKTVLALQHRELPPLLHFERPNPRLELDTSPFTAAASVSAWTTRGEPRRAGVSSFGIGGTNAHVILEEGPLSVSEAPARDAHLLLVSAKTPAALDTATRRLVDHLRSPGAASIADVSYTLQAGRQAFTERRAVVVSDAAEAITFLSAPRKTPVVTGGHQGSARPVAFLFSGQGSQHTGMGGGLYRTEPAYREAFDHCATLLEPHLGLDIREVVYGGPERQAALDETRLTQPALFAVEYALAAVWKEWGVEPCAMLGHSVGEYVAAHLASVLSLEDALKLVAHRGRLMQALPGGAMLAVHLSADEMGVWLSDGVELAAVNAPAMCAVAGPPGHIAALASRLAGAGIEHRALHTSHAFHSAMMEPALQPFVDLVADVSLSAPRIPYVSNVTGTWITPEQATSPEYYATHLRQTVRFEAGIRTLTLESPAVLLEVGPGNALATLARLSLDRSAAPRIVGSLPHPRERRSDLPAMLDAAGRLWVAGVGLDWAGVHARRPRRRVPLPTYPFERMQFRAEPRRPAAARLAALPPRSDRIDDWFYAPTWRRDAARGPTAELANTWLIIARPGELATELAARVAAAGALPVLVEPGERAGWIDPDRFVLRPDSREDFALLTRELAAAGRRIGGVFHLLSVQGPSSCPAEDDRLGVTTYHSLVALAVSLRGVSPERPLPLIVGTVGAQSVLDEAVTVPAGALVTGPVLVFPLEIPGLQVRAVDLPAGAAGEDGAAGAQALLSEATLRDGERFVAWRAGRRWVRRAEQVRLSGDAPTGSPVRAGGVYMILGGLGGIGIALATWLAKGGAGGLVLTSVHPVPPREGWDEWIASHSADDALALAIGSVREIEAGGTEVLVVEADAADEAAMRSAVEATRRRWDRIDGVIHAAGVLSGSLVLLASREEAEAVFAAKVKGISVLEKVLGDTPLDFVALCSSINSLMGGPGLSDYGSANAYLDAFAESSRKPAAWRQVSAINWWAWSEAGMAKRLVVPAGSRAAREAFVRAGIRSVDGAEAFGRVVTSNLPRVVVAPYDLTHPQFLHPVPDQEARPAAAGAEAAVPARQVIHPRQELSSAHEAPVNPAEEELVRIWGELLGIDGIGINDDFFELGGHSLLATRVLARIEEGFGVQLPLRSAFDAPTIRQQARLIETTRELLTGSKQTAGEEREEIEF